MADIFREVDEELRNEKAVAAFTRWQPYIVGVTIALIAALAGYHYYADRQKAAREAAGAQFASALDLARVTGADPQKIKASEAALAQIAKVGPKGYKALALLREAALVGKSDAVKGASDFDALAISPNLSPLLQDVAKLRAAWLVVDSASLADMMKRLETLAVPKGPFAASAFEILAVSALSHNDLKSAGDWLDKIITDPAAPPATKARAEELSGIVRAGPLPGTSAASAAK